MTRQGPGPSSSLPGRREVSRVTEKATLRSWLRRGLQRAVVFGFVVFSGRILAAPLSIPHLTIYEAGLAGVVEEREVDLQPGLNTIEWRSLLPGAQLATVRVTAKDCEVIRQDVTLDGPEIRGGRTPVLHLTVRSKERAARRVQVSYLAPSMDWGAEYTLLLPPGSEEASVVDAELGGWISVFNRTGADLVAGVATLVAGEVSLAEKGQQRDQGGYQVAYQQAYMSSGDDGSSSALRDLGAKATGLSAFTRFDLGREIALAANAPVSRFPLLQEAHLLVEQRHVIESSYNQETLGEGAFTLRPRAVEVRLVAKNSTKKPLPAGLVTVFATAEGVPIVVGQDQIALTPVGGDFTVAQGRSSEVFATRRVTEREIVKASASASGYDDALETSVEVVVSSLKSIPLQVYVREEVESFRDGHWQILRSSPPAGERLAKLKTEFKVDVPAGGETKLTYTVQAY